jgi:signal transduction histidine kinase
VTCDPRFVNKAWAKAEGLTACIVLPLIYRERVMGVLAMFTRGAHVFSSEEVQLLRSFADHAAIALENARLYEEVQRHAGDLEVRVQERTRDLEKAVRQAEAASAAKSDFLANMSHELRTPLNSVIGFSELLQGLSFGPLSERQARFVTNIHTSGKHLLDIVTDILDLTKVEAGKLTLRYESFEVEPVLEEVVTLVREVAVKKSQALTVNIAPGLPPLSADPMRFRQICFNLLSNAVKFTAPGGAVRVTARRICDFRLPICDLKSGDSEPQSQIANPKSEMSLPPQSAIGNRQSAIESSWLELSVTDTGVGIKPEDMPRLFQEFVQLEPAMTKHHEGTGLGLALAKRLVELHGGRIWATSPGEGQGSTFTVLLPFEGPVGRKQEAGGS